MARKIVARKPRSMGDKYVEIVISPDGKVTEEVHGIEDGSCTELTSSFERSVGRVQKRREFGACAKNRVRQK